MKWKNGFTLIELMIVVAIVAILAAIAIPAYQNYTIRAKMTEAFSFAAHAKTAVETWRQSGGSGSPSNSAVGISSSDTSNYVSAVTVAGTSSAPTIALTVTSAVTGTAGTITLTGSATGNVLTWACTSGFEQKYLPASCTGSG